LRYVFDIKEHCNGKGAGIGLAAGLTEPTAGLGAVGGYAGLRDYTPLGGRHKTRRVFHHWQFS
jgi:hypothetical protein